MNKSQFNRWCQTFDTSCNDQSQTLIMGILNVTSDSFTDGGQFIRPEKALERAMTMIEEGVDIIDIGGESSQPGIDPISLDLELSRVIPVIEKIASRSNICISIDTYKSEVMRMAIEAGASIINDIKALREVGSLVVAAELNVPVCLMHMKGISKFMQQAPYYANGLIEEINEFFAERIQVCLEAGIDKKNIILDPGFGFGKSIQHNLLIMKRMKEFKKYGLPLLLGVSRKSTIGAISDVPIESRMSGSLAAAVHAILNGVSIIRTHDVKETLQAVKVINAITSSESKECL